MLARLLLMNETGARVLASLGQQRHPDCYDTRWLTLEGCCRSSLKWRSCLAPKAGAVKRV